MRGNEECAANTHGAVWPNPTPRPADGWGYAGADADRNGPKCAAANQESKSLQTLTWDWRLEE